MGCFLFQPCSFQSSLPFPRPPPGFDFFICDGSRAASAQSPEMNSLGMRYGRLLRPSLLGQPGWQICHPQPVDAHPAPAAARENPAGNRVFPPGLFAAALQSFGHKLTSGFLATLPPGQQPGRGEVTTCSIQ